MVLHAFLTGLSSKMMYFRIKLAILNMKTIFVSVIRYPY